MACSITAHYIGTGEAGASHVKVQTGTLTGEFVNVRVTGPAPIFQAAGITANGASGHSCECGNGYVKAQLFPVAPSSGSINITGPVKSVHGNVTLDAANGTVTDSSGAAGKITAGFGITVTGGQIQLGSLSAGGMIKVTASGAGHADSITINGNIKAPGVQLQAFTAGGSGGNITVNGNITGLAAPSPSFFSSGVRITANAGSSHSGGNISITGKVSAVSGGVFLNAHGGGNSGGNIDVGNISASSGVSISARYNGGSTGFHVKTGTITGGYINVNLAGLDPQFSATGLAGTGLGCECSADVSVRLSNASFSAAPGGSINITGPVTATAGGVNLDAGFGVLNMNGALISATGSFGHVRLRGGQLHVGSITATDNVSISASGTSGSAASITRRPPIPSRVPVSASA